MENQKTTNNTLQKYFYEMGQYEVLSPEEELSCAQKMVSAYEQLVDEMLKVPFVWEKIYNKWLRLKKLNKATNKLAEEYGNPKYPSDELTLQVDSNIEGAVALIKQNKIKEAAYLFKQAKLAKAVYMNLVDETVAQPNTQYFSQDNRDRICRLEGEVTKHHHNLVTANLRLVIKFAKNFNNYGIPLADLIQEGNIGLMRAAEKFDPSRELKFSTYAAWWIRQSFIKAVKRQGKTIRLPSHIHDAMNKLKKVHDNLYCELNREPSVSEIAEASELDVDLVERLLDLKSEPLSLETPVSTLTYRSDTRPKYIQDYLQDTSIDPTNEIDNLRKKQKIQNAIEKLLTNSERQVIILRFGLNGRGPSTHEEIAEKLKVSRERIRQLEQIAMEKLKKNSSYLGEYDND